MRILSWNINGIRTLPQYHPWNTFKDCSGILDELGADIVCFQEMKSSRTILPRDVAVPVSYTSYFSFPAMKSGYSGVAIYAKSAAAVPLKAEEGISGRTQPKPPHSADERIAKVYPSINDVELVPDEEGNVPATFDALDAEGRGLILDFGLFVLINVYCPNETSDARLGFKMNYHLLLEARVRQLIAEGREVIVLGDMNICATPLDHCDGHLPSIAADFWEHPARAWFRDWIGPDGPLVDVVRTYWPDRKGLYTCWNTRIAARETNYGTRVDYILVTRGLLKWIKHGDIQPSLKGSDHCPIYIDLHDEVTLASGEVVKLREAMQQSEPPREAPRIAAKYWDEFSGKQKLLSSFFGKKSDLTAPDDESSGSPSPSQTKEISSQPLPAIADAGSSKLSRKPSATQGASKKRPLVASSSQAASSKKTKKDPGQATLGSFFGKTKNASSSAASSATEKAKSVEVIVLDGDSESNSSNLPISSAQDEAQLEADYRLACELAASQDFGEPSSSPLSSQSKTAWSTLFTPVQPPKCTVHGEPAKRYTVNKPGPNKGRAFYLCSRPVGPGYDRGKADRLRHEVDPQYHCNYFKWASDVKRDSSSS